MTSTGLFQIVLFFLILLALTKPMGAFMARLFEGERTFLHPVIRPLERLVYKLSGVDEAADHLPTLEADLDSNPIVVSHSTPPPRERRGQKPDARKRPEGRRGPRAA